MTSTTTRTAPLTYAQERLWFLHQVTPDALSYISTGALALDGPLDVEVLRRAVHGVVARHETLRTRFVQQDGGPVQVVDDVGAPGPSMVVTRLDDVPPDERDARTSRVATQRAREPFRLEARPPLRVELLQWGPREHTLLLLAHHIVTDGWSLYVLFDEVAQLYDAAMLGVSPGLAELPTRYTDHVHRQRAAGHDPAALRFWLDHLDGAPPILDLPRDRPRPRVQTTAGDTHTEHLGEEVTAGLRDVGRAARATPFMILHAACAVLLGAWAGADDVVLGVPSAGRTDPAVEPLVGLFVNTLAVRTRIDRDASFLDLITAVRRTALSALQYQDVPFEVLVRELGVEREASHAPVFQAGFAVHNVPRALRSPRGLTARQVHVDLPTSRFDLNVGLTPESEGFRLRLQYNTDLFDPGTVRRLARSFRVLLRAALSAPSTRVGDLPVLDPDERRRVIEELAPGPLLASPGDVVTSVARRARAEPNAVAVACGGDTCTYGELLADAGAVAAALARRGVGPGDAVGVQSRGSLRLPAAVLGVLAARAVYVPLDPAHPAERLRGIVADAGCVAVLHDEDADPSALTEASWALALGAARDLEPLVLDPSTPMPPDDLAYVMYTSGSTGRPKGVEVARGSLAAFAAAAPAALGLGPSDVVVASTSISFDISLLEFLVPLCVGAQVRMVRGGASDPEAFRRAVSDLPAPTAAGGTPSTWRYLRRAGLRWPAGVRLLTGGEPLPADLSETLLADGLEVWNLYGPTEATVYVTTARVTGTTPEGVPATSIGRPLPGNRVYVLSPDLEPVPLGVTGELWLAGPQVARGYRGRPDDTEARFRPDPFTASPHARMYRTGDLGRLRADGTFELSGRTDDQVKVHGVRLDPGEVEAVLCEHPDVAGAAVVLREDRPGDARLIAYVLPASDTAPDPSELRRRARERLPSQAVPSAYVSVTDFPVSVSGKLDRAHLPAPPSGPEEPAQRSAEPIVRLLEELFGELLGTPVGPDADFFASGGHSMLAITLVGRVADELDLDDVPALVIRLFEAPTPAGFADRISVLLEEGTPA